MVNVDIWFVVAGYILAVAVAMIAYAHSTWIQPRRQASLYESLTEAQVIAQSSKSEVSRLHDVLKYTNEMLDEEKRAKVALENELATYRKKDGTGMGKRPLPTSLPTATSPAVPPTPSKDDNDATSRLTKTPTKEGTGRG